MAKQLLQLLLLIGLFHVSLSAQELVTADDLAYAAQNYEIHTLRKLLKQNPLAISELTSTGDSALASAITSRPQRGQEQRQLDCVKFLLSQGADPNQRTGGIAPLELAMLMNIEIVKALLDEGADPFNVGEEGISPMDTAQSLKGETAEEIRRMFEAKRP